jgi:hypothetical protein
VNSKPKTFNQVQTESENYFGGKKKKKKKAIQKFEKKKPQENSKETEWIGHDSFAGEV